MTQILYAVFQEEMGGNELQGLVTSLQAAMGWVNQLHHIYRLTHFDPIQARPLEGEVLRWEALYGCWEIRKVPVLDAAPVLEPPAAVVLVQRLLAHTRAEITIADLPPAQQEIVRAEQEATPGANTLHFGRHPDLGWFVLHYDEDLVYLVDVEHDPSVENPEEP